MNEAQKQRNRENVARFRARNADSRIVEYAKKKARRLKVNLEQFPAIAAWRARNKRTANQP